MKRVEFTEAEIASEADFDKVGQYTRDGVDHLVGGAIGYPNHWAAFTVSQVNASVLSITPGRLFDNDIVYASEAVETVDLMLQLPGIAPNRRWVGVIAQGAEVTINAQRPVETNIETGETVLVSLPKVIDRKVNFILQPGQQEIADDPSKPVVPGNQCCIAFVLLGVTGILDIIPGTDWRVKTLYEVEGRVTTLELTLANTIERTSTLETNLANMAGQLGDIPRRELMLQLQNDAAQTRRILKMPAAARNYWHSAGLVQEQWDKQNPNWLARVREGVRFPFAQIVDNQLAIPNPASATIRLTDNILLPDWSEVARITVEGGTGTKDISQQVHTETTAIENTISHTSISYGPSFGVCENQAEWANMADKRVGETFNVGGVAYVAQGVAQGTLVNAVTGNLLDFSAYNANPGSAGHKGYGVAQVQYDTWSETYWTYHTKEYGVKGSIYGNTFLNSQPGVMTSIDLEFDRVAADGVVHLYVCKCDATGAPQFTNVVAHKSLAASDLVIGRNKFAFTPFLVDIGQRYAWYTVTVGNHSLRTVTGNKYAQGSMFWCTDGVWAQGDPLLDFCFRANYAQFTGVRTVVDFGALNCPLGMTEIQLLYAGWAPAGTSLTWQVKPHGDNEWHDIQSGDASPLYGLPALTALRAVFVHTTDLAPAIQLDETARGVAMRVRGDMKAVSEVMEFGFASTVITMVATLDRFDPDFATYTPQILVGTTPVSASVSTISIDRSKENRRTVTSIFNLGAAATSCQAFPQMTNTRLTNVPFIENLLLTAS